MHIIETIYIIAVLMSISACIPQLRQLVITKASDEFSVSTWAIWLGTQCATLLYVVTLNNLLMILANIIWVSFYTVMLALIVHYRRQSQRTLEAEPVEA